MNYNVNVFKNNNTNNNENESMSCFNEHNIPSNLNENLNRQNKKVEFNKELTNFYKKDKVGTKYHYI